MTEFMQQSQRSVDPTVETFSVLGLPLHLMADYSAWLRRRLQLGKGVHVVTLNAEMAIQAERNEALASVIHHAELVIPDGAGVVLYLRLRGKRAQRCPGIELAETLIRESAHHSGETPYTIFFYGGAPGVTEAAAQALQQRIPGLAFSGVEHGYLSSDEQRALSDRLAALQPNIICVGLGVPRQEFWIAEHRHLCPNAIWIGVGGSFDIWSGTKTRAPSWLRNNNLEWVYRLYQEPWRWRRMTALPQFAWKALTHWGR